MNTSILIGKTRIEGTNELNNDFVKKEMRSIGKLIQGAVFFHTCAAAGCSKPTSDENKPDEGMKFIEKIAENFGRPVWGSRSWVPAYEYQFGKYDKKIYHKYKDKNTGKEVAKWVEHLYHPKDNLGYDGWLDYWKRDGKTPYPDKTRDVQKDNPDNWKIIKTEKNGQVISNTDEKFANKDAFEDRRNGAKQAKVQCGKWVHADYEGTNFKSYIVDRIKIYPNGLIRDKAGNSYWQ